MKQLIFIIIISSILYAQDTTNLKWMTINLKIIPDTEKVELFVVRDSIKLPYPSSYFKFPCKVLILLNGYAVYSRWGASTYLDDKKQPLKEKVYFLFGGKK